MEKYFFSQTKYGKTVQHLKKLNKEYDYKAGKCTQYPNYITENCIKVRYSMIMTVHSHHAGEYMMMLTVIQHSFRH